MKAQQQSIYSSIYNKLIQEGVNKKNLWKKGSGLHRHRIHPGFENGTYDDENCTYLTVREHKIVHWLRWKLYGSYGDLSSARLLGANLTPEQRAACGRWCAENGIGFHDAKWDSLRGEWGRKGAQVQIDNKIGIHDPANAVKYASIGGKASIASKNNPWSYWASEEGRRERAHLGGKSHIGKIWISRDGQTTRCLEEEFLDKVDEGWSFGMAKADPTKARVYINKDGNTKRVKNVDFVEMFKNGWRLGKDESYTPNRRRSKKDLRVSLDAP